MKTTPPHKTNCLPIGAGNMCRTIVGGVLVTALLSTMVPARAVAEVAGIDNSTATMTAAEAQQSIEAYSADFAMGDIALPEGVVATEAGLEVTDTASPVVQEAAANTGAANWKNASTAVDYAVEALGYVSKDARKVGEFGKSMFNIIKSGSSGDIKGVISSVKAFLRLSGAIKGKSAGPSNADLMNEMRELNNLVQAMTQELDANTRRTYQNRLTVFDNAVGALSIECAAAETMYAKGYALAEERGLINQPEPTRPEKSQELTREESRLEDLRKKTDEYKQSQEQFEADCAEFRAQEAELEQQVNELAQVRDEADANYREVASENTPIREQRLGEFQKADGACYEAEMKLDSLRSAFALKYPGGEHVRIDIEQKLADNEQKVADAEAALKSAQDEYAQQLADYQTAHDQWGRYENTSSALVTLMRDEDQKGNRDFRDFSSLVNSIRQNFEIVAVECAKQGGSSPFHAFDSYWAMHFNFDTQGYFLRQAYRTNAECQLKRAYAILGLYFDIPSAVQTGEDEPYTAALKSALNVIDAQPAGTNPETLCGKGGVSSFHYAAPVHCYTLNRDFECSKRKAGLASIDTEHHFTDKEVKAFCERLHGRTVAEDLRLAGVMVEYSDEWNESDYCKQTGYRFSPERYLGLGVRHKVNKGNKWTTYYLPFDATRFDLKSYDEAGKTYTVMCLLPEGVSY